MFTKIQVLQNLISISATKRKIRNVLISSEDLIKLQGCTIEALKQIFQAQGINFKRLVIEHCQIKLPDFQYLLKHIPNIESISITSSYAQYTADEDVVISQLSRVNDLTMLYCNPILQTYLLSSINEGTVKSFSYTSESFDSINSFLTNQKNIKKLSMHDPNCIKRRSLIHSKFFKELAIHDLSISANGFKGQDSLFRSVILLQAPYLQKLDISGSLVNDKVFRLIARIANRLETFSLNVNTLKPDDFTFFAYLKNLKELTIINNSCATRDTQLELLAIVKLPLTKLEIKLPMVEILPNTIHKLNAKLPSLKHLHIDCQLDYVTLTAILGNFEHLKTLELRSSSELNPLEQGILALSNEIYVTNILHLAFYVNISMETLFPLKMSVFFPRLECLEIQTNESEDNVANFILAILHDFPSLKQLKVDNTNSIKLKKHFVMDLSSKSIYMHLVSFYIAALPNFVKEILAEAFNNIATVGEKIILKRQ